MWFATPDSTTKQVLCGEESRITQISIITGAFLGTQIVKNMSPMQETQVQSLGWNDPLEKGSGTHSSILAWRIPWTKETLRLVHGVTKSWTQLSIFFFLFLYTVMLRGKKVILNYYVVCLYCVKLA